jgi:hypothetical protein
MLLKTCTFSSTLYLTKIEAAQRNDAVMQDRPSYNNIFLAKAGNSAF